MAANLTAAFDALQPLLAAEQNGLGPARTGPGVYHLYAAKSYMNSPQMYFAGVQIKKNYVSLYFMPIYMAPASFSISPALKKRMQGKSCFNFTTAEPELLAEIKNLLATGKQYFKGLNLLVD